MLYEVITLSRTLNREVEESKGYLTDSEFSWQHLLVRKPVSTKVT